ncbi:helix-turn-helix domain-containing protein [Sinorhizobium meliloti]|nr:helix-turn-helix domain-containing protein [Sinorhizobium meliloti]
MAKKVTPHLKPERPRYFFKEWRKKRGLTQEELAETVGVTPSSISQLENGKQGFTDTTLSALAEALSCNPGDLLMRNPLDEDAPWSIWDNVKKASPDKRREIVAVVETMLRTGTDR